MAGEDKRGTGQLEGKCLSPPSSTAMLHCNLLFFLTVSCSFVARPCRQSKNQAGRWLVVACYYCYYCHHTICSHDVRAVVIFSALHRSLLLLFYIYIIYLYFFLNVFYISSRMRIQRTFLKANHDVTTNK
jgi:hypothetical protein